MLYILTLICHRPRVDIDIIIQVLERVEVVVIYAARQSQENNNMTGFIDEASRA